MAYLSERIGQRTLEIMDGEFVNNARFSYTRKIDLENMNTKEECIKVTYEVTYGNGKAFTMINAMYRNYKNPIQRPIIISDMDDAQIDADIKRLHDLLK